MNIGLFLGAGASVPYGFKTTNTIKPIIISKTKFMDLSDFVDNILHDENYPDIEYLLDICNKIIALNANKHVARALDHIRFNYQNHNHSYSKFIDSIVTLKNILYDLIFSEYRLTGDSKLFDTIYGVIYDKIKSLDSNVQLYVFTTNYDQVVEKYYTDHDINYYDGFINKKNLTYKIYDGKFDTNVDVENHLYKLHGSLNWKKNKKNNEIQSHGPEQQLIGYDDVMIEPTLSPKNEESEEPFHTYSKQFEKFIMNNRYCIVIGFSFRDYEKIFANFIKNNGTLIIISKSGKTNFVDNCIKKHIDDFDHINSNTIFDKALVNHMICDKSNNPLGAFFTYNENITSHNIDHIMSVIITCIRAFTKISTEREPFLNQK